LDLFYFGDNSFFEVLLKIFVLQS